MGGHSLGKPRSLSVQAVALALGSGVAQLIVAVLFILSARSMRPEQYGLVVSAMALGGFGAALVDFGSTTYWIRELASGRLPQNELSARMSTRLLISLATSVMIIVIATLTHPQFIAAGVLMFSTTTAATTLVPLRAARRAEVVGLLTVLSRTIAAVGFLTLLTLGVIPGIALWLSLAIGDLCLAAYVAVSGHSGFALSRKLSNPWSGAKWFSLTSMSASAQQLDLPILAGFAGAAAAGIYGGVNRWTQPLLLATVSFVSAAAPFLAAEQNLRALRTQVLRASWMLGVVMLLSATAIFFAPWLVTVLLGDAYASSATVLRWLAGAMMLNAIAQPLMVALLSRQFDHLAAVILFLSVGVQLSIVAVCGTTLGPLSAGLGVFASQALQLIGSGVSIGLIARRRRL